MSNVLATQLSPAGRFINTDICSTITKAGAKEATGLQGKGATVPRAYSATGIQGHRATGLQIYRVTGSQGHGLTRVRFYTVFMSPQHGRRNRNADSR
ncbi:unnamed protein product [Boreogadus saida]